MKAKKPVLHESRIYRQFSRLYEPIFSRFFSRGIRSAIRSLDIPPGAKILEVGVGSGLSLPEYPPHAEVTAIDISSEMLAQAREKIAQNGWCHIELCQMDALDLDFPDEHFDYVTAFHVVTVVPNPDRLVREAVRVCKPAGTFVVVNHFRSPRKWLASMLDLLDPVTRRLGWRMSVRVDELVDGAPLSVAERFKISPRSLFTVVVAEKHTSDELATASAE